jgi:hypothetical protein
MQVTDKMVRVLYSTYEALTGHDTMDCEECLKNALEAAIQAAWVSVDDSLPEYGLVVLNQNGNKVRCRNGVWSMLVIHGERNFLGELSSPNEQWYHCDDGEVTHWMPLPEHKV